MPILQPQLTALTTVCIMAITIKNNKRNFDKVIQRL